MRRDVLRRVDGDGVSLSYATWPGEGQTLVGIHGITASYCNFVGIAARLEKRRPLVAFDLRGRGDSDKPAGPYGMDQHADDVATAMRALDLGPTVIVGHSMGAYIAAGVAARHPDLVSGVVLLDGGYLLDPPPGVDIGDLLDTLLTPQIARLSLTFSTRQAYHDYWRALPTFAGTWNPWVEDYLDYDVAGSPLQPRASEAAVRYDFADMADRRAAEARLRAVKVPVMVIRAEHGLAPGQPPVIPDVVLDGIRACVPGVEEHLIPTTTHYTIALADPGATRVADLVVAFAARCSTGGTGDTPSG